MDLHLLQPGAPLTRDAILVGATAAVTLAERWRPQRPGARPRRWSTHLALFSLSLGLGLLLPLTLLTTAYAAQTAGFGLFNWLPDRNGWQVPAAAVALDAVLYWQHRLMHRVEWLWRLHRVHHTDPHFDVSTALRFHPLEWLVGQLLLCLGVLALGAPPAAVLLFSLVKGLQSVFEHANLRLPAGLDRLLRPVLVTPDLHRVHHSLDAIEGNSNFATVFSFWDRLFGSFCACPSQPQETMALGVAGFGDTTPQDLMGLLMQPLRPAGSSQPAP